MNGHTWQNPILPAVGRLYDQAGDPSINNGQCSGTMLFRGIVLTAGHCLYEQSSRTYIAPSRLSFVPGNTTNGLQPVSDYGTWQVVDAYVPTEYQQGFDVDWGLAVLAPDSTGRYAGDYTGTFPSYGNVRLDDGTPVVRMGYPASGPWATPTYFRGAGQYYCSETISSVEQKQDTGLWWLAFWNRCPMNGGSSGGPNFVQFSDGRWGIIAVNNRGCGPCPQVGRPSWGEQAYNQWFDQRYVDFVNTVMAQLNG